MGWLTIGSREVSADAPVLVIAEIGVNHDGQLDRALELVKVARAAGADAVKLQIFQAHTLMNGTGEFAGYQTKRCKDATPAAMLRRYELPEQDVATVVDAIWAARMLPLATPFSLSDVDLIDALRLPAIKIASPDLVNRPLLRRAAASGRPLLVSTGATTIQEVERAVEWLRQWHAPFALLHCVSAYPTDARYANLCWIGELAGRFAVPVGYSDHTTEIIAGALAVAAGACAVEKHLTYDRSAPGPDHAASADPGQFADYVKLIRQAQTLRGRGTRHVLGVEQDVRRVSRQSLVSRRALGAGDVLCADDLIVQRPGTGIAAAEFDRVVGRKLLAACRAGEMLRWEMLAA